MTVKELFEDLARATWQRLCDGYRLDIRQGETGLTDLNLLEIRRAHLPCIDVHKTGIREEKWKGTDWEWWVGSDITGWIRYAIQAKRLHLPNETYTSLNKRGEDQRRQLDKLVEYATLNEAVPLYCFFNYTEQPTLDQFWHCDLPLEPEQLGCTLTSASVVENALSRRGRNFRWIHLDPETMPWRCIVSCPHFLQFYQLAAATRGAQSHSDFPFGKLPTLHRRPPIRSSMSPRAQNIGRTLDRDFYKGDPQSFPSYVATIDISGSFIGTTGR